MISSALGTQSVEQDSDSSRSLKLLLCLDEALDQFSVLLLLFIPDAAHNCCVVRELLHMAELRVVLKVRRVQGEQD